MTDPRHRNDPKNFNSEEIETFVGVKNLLKEFGEKMATARNDDGDNFVSVKDRLRKFDSRHDDDDDCDSEGNTVTNVAERCKDVNQSRVPSPSVRDFSTGYTATPGKTSSAVYGPIASSPLTNSASYVMNNAVAMTSGSKLAHHKAQSLTPLDYSMTNGTNPKVSPPSTVSMVHGDRPTAGSSSSLKENSSKEIFQYGNVLLKKVEKPVEDKWKTNSACESASELSETQRKIEDLLKKVDTPIEDRWKRKVAKESLAYAVETKHKIPDFIRKVENPIEDRWKKNRNEASKEKDISGRLPLPSIVSPSNKRMKQESLSRTKTYPNQNFIKNDDLSQSKSLHKRRPIPKTTPSTSNYNNSQSLNTRSVSLPTFAGAKQDQSTAVREETHRNDLTATLKKVGFPVEDRWKSMKNSEEDVPDTSSKPAFATMKLKSVSTLTSNSSSQITADSRCNKRRQYFDDQRVYNGMKQTFNFDEEGKKLTILKGGRVPPTDDMTLTSAIYYGESDREEYLSKSAPHKPSAEGISVSDLAKTFSQKVGLASKSESAMEENAAGSMTAKSNEITHIRYTLKTTAIELDDLKKALNLSTPVSKLIAERNKASQANRSKNNFGVKKTHRRTKSCGSESSHRRTKSMLPTAAEISDVDGRTSARVFPSPSLKRNRDGDGVIGNSGNTTEVDYTDDFSERWENFKANNIIVESGDIWNLNLDDSAFLNGHSNCSCPAKYYDDDISGSQHDHSTLSECTSASDGDFCHDMFGHSRYIQITLSSGGITEKFEPTIVMSPTDSPTASDGLSMIDTSIVDANDSKQEKLKVLLPLKGAKKFFFGKNKRKSTPIEV
mmetsp:Transcript_4607/g.11843  ORF Transcript_4607/g.11843 Transcript_4607/m.11843 type:complete len:835 (-) Transcript_4607:150-2654(-)|eukprot:CAMPEP_0197186430 /NCGR_PEP_ID=MMETSP1423-20130617/13898_1 /TAXON_ID=476441 /ORGANISM="Pseudo-nitzschia heimii, Strain UNC1101" /LENGTH=834 /DNA_ID=CAMNT_0042637749 /DNA_START=96 /DNA_END=2600 /DNA_ORIENTATION=+